MVYGKTIVLHKKLLGRQVSLSVFDGLIAIIGIIIAFYLQDTSEVLHKVNDQYIEVISGYAAFSQWQESIEKDLNNKTGLRWDSKDEERHELAQEKNWALKFQFQETKLKQIKSHVIKYHPAMIGSHNGTQ